MEPRSTKNVATSILTQDSNFWTSKTPITEISCKSNEFDKFTKKSSLTGIFPNLDTSKIFTNVPRPSVKLNKENDGEVAEAVRPTVLIYAQIVCRNGAQVNQKWCYLDFDPGIEFVDLKSRYNRSFVQIERIR